MNTIIGLCIILVFSYAEDCWFKRLLIADISIEKKSKNVCRDKAISFFKKKAGRFSWVWLATGLIFIALSFPAPFTFSFYGASFVAGVILCLSYIIWVIRAQLEAIKALKE